MCDCFTLLGIISVDLWESGAGFWTVFRGGGKRGAQALHLHWQVRRAHWFSVALCKLFSGRRPLPLLRSESRFFIYLSPVSQEICLPLRQLCKCSSSYLLRGNPKWLRSSRKKWIVVYRCLVDQSLFNDWEPWARSGRLRTWCLFLLKNRHSGMPQTPEELRFLSTASYHRPSIHSLFTLHVVLNLSVQPEILCLLSLASGEVLSIVGHFRYLKVSLWFE